MAKINKNTENILNERYYYKDSTTGKTLENKPEQMFRRVANWIARAEETEKLKEEYEEIFYNLMDDQLFMPNTPTLIGSGYPNKCLSACSVLGQIPDNLPGIYEFMAKNAMLTKSGCGVGQDLSIIRPKGELIKSSGGISAGVVNWMYLINTVATTTIQGDKARRAANMVSLRFNHPDIFDFINSKKNDKTLSAMNISVTIKNSEIKAALEGKNIDLIWNNKIYATINAKTILDNIVTNMYNNGEPGILFIDTINDGNPFNLQDGKFDEKNEHYMHTTNPCGEQNLENAELCNLGSINISSLYNSKTNEINWKKFEYCIKNSIRFLDNVITINYYPVDGFEQKAKANRKIGLGVAGLAELFVKMEIRYDSQEALDTIDKIFSFKKECEIKYNTELGIEKGNFLNWEDSIFGKKNIPARCATISTQAPTGSIANILGLTSYGIEPFFAVVYMRKIMETEFIEGIDIFKDMLKRDLKSDKKVQDVLDKCFKSGTAQIEEVPENLRNLFKCANDISPEWHIKIQAQLQKYYDNAISKTINAPENAKIEDIYNTIKLAWESNIKGYTYYRNNSRDGQTMQIGKEKYKGRILKLDSIEPLKRSEFGKTYGITERKSTACGTLYVTVNRDVDGNIVEMFVNTSKNGTCKSNIDGMNRMTSLALRSGVKVEEIIDQLKGINCAACARSRGKGNEISGLSCPDIIAKVIEKEYKGFIAQPVKKIKKNKETEEEIKNPCPECGKPLSRTEGCYSCLNCGYSKCS